MNDLQFEKLMSAVAVRQVQLLDRSLPSDTELAAMEVSKEFEQKMQELLRKEKTRRKVYRGKKQIGKLVASIAVVLVLSFGAVLSVSANRAQFFQFFGRSFSISGEQRQNWSQGFNLQTAREYRNVYLPTWLPEGFQVTTVSHTEESFIIDYKKDGKSIRLSESDTSVNVLSDAELKGMERIVVGNQIYYYGEKLVEGKNSRQMIWQTDKSALILTSDCSKEETLKIAQNVQFNKE